MSFGRITKLKINVGKTQTHITYEKGATRLFSSNPSGFVFRSPSSKDIEHKQLSKQCAATIFLQRHFGTGGSIRKTPSVRMLLSALGLAESVSQTELQMAEEQQQQQQLPAKSEPTWYSCKLELLPAVVAQHAHSLVVPTGRLLLSCCGWHLQNCSERLAQTSNNCEFSLPNCECWRIKETMDSITQLLDESLAMQAQGEAESREMPELNANMMSLNALLKQLNELMELQNQHQNSD